MFVKVTDACNVFLLPELSCLPFSYFVDFIQSCKSCWLWSSFISDISVFAPPLLQVRWGDIELMDCWCNIYVSTPDFWAMLGTSSNFQIQYNQNPNPTKSLNNPQSSTRGDRLSLILLLPIYLFCRYWPYQPIPMSQPCMRQYTVFIIFSRRECAAVFYSSLPFTWLECYPNSRLKVTLMVIYPCSWETQTRYGRKGLTWETTEPARSALSCSEENYMLIKGHCWIWGKS